MGTKYHASPEETQALDTVIKVLRAANSVDAHVSVWLREKNLTITQFGILEALFFSGEMKASVLAQKVLRTCGNMTYVLDQLADRDFICRERNPHNRREVTVFLTPLGHQLIGVIFPEHAARVTQFFGVLAAEEQKLLGALCKKLGLQEGVAKTA